MRSPRPTRLLQRNQKIPFVGVPLSCSLFGLLHLTLFQNEEQLLLALGATAALLLASWVLFLVVLWRRRREVQHQQEDRRNRLIVEAAADAIITFDYTGRIESFNAAASRLFGYAPEEIIGQNISQLLQTNTAISVDSYLRRVIRTEGAKVLPLALLVLGRHRDGHTIPIELGVSKVLDEDRHLYVQIIRDLSERHQAERHRQLHVEVAQLLGGDDPLAVVGPQVLQAIGQALGWRAGLLRLVDSETQQLQVAAAWSADAAHALHVEQAWRTPLALGEGLSGQAWSLREAQQDRTIGLAWPILLADEVLGVLELRSGMMQHLDAAVARCLLPVSTQLAQYILRQRDQEMLRRAKEEAEEASRAKSEFLANISHEIRTPLNGVLGLVDLLLSGETERQQEYLQLIRYSAETLLSLINDLLDVAKLDATEMVLHQVAFQPRESLEPMLRTQAIRAEQKGLKLSWLIHQDVPDWLIGDPLRLQQVFLNLIGNAIKFTPSGEVQVRLAVTSRTPTDVVLYGLVRDTGIGIPLEKQDRVFEAFYQVDSSRARKFGGTGLGLAITAKLVSLMGGRIWLESDTGQGSTFHFTARLTLPMLSNGSGVVGLSTSDSAAQTPPGVPLSRRILVAEDNPVNRVLLELILHKRRHHVTFVGSGREVLDRCAQEQFDLVLMDVQLPEMDGLEATQRLRRDLQYSGPIVGLTAHTDEGTRCACLDAGMRSYLTKPIQPGELLRVLDEILRG